MRDCAKRRQEPGSRFASSGRADEESNKFTPACPFQGAVERTDEPIEQLVDLGRRDDERRTDRDDIAGKESHDQPLLLSEVHGLRSDGGFRIKRAFASFMRDKLDPTYKSEPARLTDQRMITERAKPRLKLGRLACNILDDAVAGIDL